MVSGLRDYAKAKDNFVVEGLQPQGSRDERWAEEAVHAGIGLWRNVSSVKALQTALNPDVVPHQSAGVDYKVAGYGIVFRDTSNDPYSFTMPDGTRRPHSYAGVSCGTFLGPDGPHETNHNSACREKYAGSSGCLEIAGLNLNPHEQNHARKGIHLRSFNSMTFAHFVYSLRVLSELHISHNAEYNRNTLGNLLRTMAGHSDSKRFDCWSLVLR